MKLQAFTLLLLSAICALVLVAQAKAETHADAVLDGEGTISVNGEIVRTPVPIFKGDKVDIGKGSVGCMFGPGWTVPVPENSSFHFDKSMAEYKWANGRPSDDDLDRWRKRFLDHRDHDYHPSASKPGKYHKRGDRDDDDRDDCDNDHHHDRDGDHDRDDR